MAIQQITVALDVNFWLAQRHSSFCWTLSDVDLFPDAEGELRDRGASCDLLIVDELGFVPLSKTDTELLFEMLSQRYERGSTMATSNLPFQEWTEVRGSERSSQMRIIFE